MPPRKIESFDQYLERVGAAALFEELLRSLEPSRPENVRQFLAQHLSSRGRVHRPVGHAGLTSVPDNNTLVFNKEIKDPSAFVQACIMAQPAVIQWRSAGPLCKQVQASISDHVNAWLQIVKGSAKPPSFGLFFDLTDVSCWTTDANPTVATLFTAVATAYVSLWLPAIAQAAQAAGLPPSAAASLGTEILIDQEAVPCAIPGAKPTVADWVAFRSQLPHTTAFSLFPGFEQLTHTGTGVAAAAVIGTGAFKPGRLYLQCYNMTSSDYAETQPWLNDVTPNVWPFTTKQCNPPVGQSIYGGPSLLSPDAAAERIFAIFSTYGKLFQKFPLSVSGGTGKANQVMQNNIVFCFSYEANSGPGLDLLGNSEFLWNAGAYGAFADKFRALCAADIAAQPSMKTFVASNLNIGVYTAETALRRWSLL